MNPERANAESTSRSVSISVCPDSDTAPGKLSPPPLSGLDLAPKRIGGPITSGSRFATSRAIPTGIRQSVLSGR